MKLLSAISYRTSATVSRTEARLEVEDISRTLAEIEWLLVALVLLFYVLQEPGEATTFPIALALCAFTLAIVVLNYLIPQDLRNRWIIALETWLMIGLITWVLYYTGRPGQFVVALYLLPILVTAIALGRSITLLQVALIAACYVLISESADPSFFSKSHIGHFALDIAPMLLVAYTTTMLSADIVTAMNRVKTTSDTDELTGLHNTRAFNALAEHELSRALRQQRRCSVLMIDSDHLKQINDTYGHPAGDELIRTIAITVKNSIKATDVVARYGGDEFVCLLPDADAAMARQVAERIRERLAAEPLALGGRFIPITVSTGIVTCPDQGHRLSTLIKKADRALYQSKSEGRDRVSVYEETPPLRETA